MCESGSFYRELAGRIENGEMVEVFADEKKGYIKQFVTSDNSVDERCVQWFCCRPRAVICGGGHISLALCRILKMLDFRITIIDDREEFADINRFGEADEVICGSFEGLFESRNFGPNAYFIIVTRGHRFDYTCLKQILKTGCKYIGMIGSKNKIKITMQKLEEIDGMEKALLDAVKAPIGLDIGGKTPEEIAVSIAAEIIQVKRSEHKKIYYIEQSLIDQLKSGKEGILISIVEKKGSSPGKAGCHMFVDNQGNTHGTIGGGNLEHQAIMEGRKCLGNKETKLIEYDLSDNAAANLGMICGGKVKVLFEMIEKAGKQ